MRQRKKASMVLAFIFMMNIGAQAAEITCRIRTGDVGSIFGRGAKPAEALADARLKCGERRAEAYKMARHVDVDEERMSDFIDSCINLTCER